MAKKLTIQADDIENLEMDFDPERSGSKLPVDISGGKKALLQYMELPLDLIDPYGDKRNTDFTAYDEKLEASMLDSIKKYGVMEAITVRAKPDGRYELLAGERRCIYSRKAGKRTIPAHVIHADDKVARAVFSLTNLLRRNTGYQDLIAGWWHFYIALKESKALNDFRFGAVENLDPELQLKAMDSLSYRQMMRYVRMHDLTPGWVRALDDRETSIRVAQSIASLPADRQDMLLTHRRRIDEEKARKLASLGENWSEQAVENILSGRYPARRELKANPAFRKARPLIMRAAEQNLRPDDYERAEEVISEALKLYYSKGL